MVKIKYNPETKTYNIHELAIAYPNIAGECAKSYRGTDPNNYFIAELMDNGIEMEEEYERED